MTATSRTTQTYERLKTDLLDARHVPGAKLKIDQICADYGVSPSAVREALARLTSDGLVRAEPQRGFIAAPVSAAELIDLTAVRIDIELRCLRSAIGTGSLEWEGRIMSALHQLRRQQELVVQSQDRRVMSPDWMRLHGEFHDSLIAACDSRWWLRLRDQLYLQAERYRRLLVPYAHVERDTGAEHAAIAEATLARDADRACELLRAHLQLTTDILLSSDVPFEDMADPQAGTRPAARAG